MTTIYSDTYKNYHIAAPMLKSSLMLGIALQEDEFIAITDLANKVTQLPSLILSDDDPTLNYRDDIYSEFNIFGKRRRYPGLHLGQRKLLLSEVYFLTKYGNAGDTILYVGAAPGDHIPILVELFPEFNFYLYDPVFFKKQLLMIDRITTYNQLFTNVDAQRWASGGDLHTLHVNKNLLFISDIRSNIGGIEKEQAVYENMNWQKEWIEIINPFMSMVKFRFPYDRQGAYEYLKGDVFLQIWAPLDSTETRLIVSGVGKEALDENGCFSYPMKVYDPIKYESQLFYINIVLRIWASYKFNVNCSNVDYSYDCAMEYMIWCEYLNSKDVPISPNIVGDLFALANNLRPIIFPYGHHKGYSMFEKIWSMYSEYTKYQRQKKGMYENSRTIIKQPVTIENINVFKTYLKKTSNENIFILANYNLKNPLMYQTVKEYFIVLETNLEQLKSEQLDVRNTGLSMEQVSELLPKGVIDKIKKIFI
jgi:hypothetical protein